MASRKGSRRSSRRTNRKNRRTNRRSRQRGGAYNPMALSLAQGQEYQELHTNQHGGGGYQAGGYAPVGDQGLLPADLRTMARVSSLDGALEQIKGMSDLPQPQVPKQSGGGVAAPPDPPAARRNRRRRNGRKSTNRRASGRKNTRRCWTRRNRRNSRRSQRGGGLNTLLGAPYNAPGMLLTPAEAARAGTADFSDPLLKGR